MSEKPSSAQPPAPPRRWRRIVRTFLRGLRITLLLVLFAVVVAGFFVNKIGVPDFVKKRLVAQLQAKGWEVDFSRIRVRWYRGIVADDLYLRRTNGVFGPNLFVQRAECPLNYGALIRRKLDIRSFKMQGGRLVWPIARDNEPHRPFILNGAAAELSFRDNDMWDLRFLNGELLGANVHLSGTITNGSLIRDWRMGERRPRPARDPVAVWEELARTAAQVRFAGEPHLEGSFRGDAADLRSFDASLKFRVPGVLSPWGAGTNVLLTARLFPGRSEVEGVQADFTLTAAEVVTDWLTAAELRMNLEVEPRYTNAWPTNVNLAVELKSALSRWGTTEYALLTTRVTACATNSSLIQTELKAMMRNYTNEARSIGGGDIKLVAVHPPGEGLPAHVIGNGEFTNCRSREGNAQKLSVKFDGNLPAQTDWSLHNTNLAWPDRIKPFTFKSDFVFLDVSGPRLEARRMDLFADWQWPRLRCKSGGALYGGGFEAQAEVDVESRELGFDGKSTFDVHRIAPLLGPDAQKFLRSYHWQLPPKLEASGRVTLPPWTNGPLKFEGRAISNFSLAGAFNVGAGAYRGATFSAAQSPFTFTNDVWRIAPLKLKRPEGELLGAYTSYPTRKQFHWTVRSTVDPRAFKPLFTNAAERAAFDFFEFTKPPFVEGEIWGNWRQPERTGMYAKVRGNDFKFRGETIGQCSGTLLYTNFLLSILNPEIVRPGEKGVAPGISIDFKKQRVWLTNAFGNLDPQAVARCISRQTGEIMEDYIFAAPPTIRLNGSVDLKRGSDEDDLHFEISGGAFRWKDFRFEQLAGNIEWVGRTMALTNMHGIFHGGRTAGYAHFAFPRKRGADFSFRLSVAEVDFHSLMSDLRRTTNNLEGMLNGELTVVAGNTAQPNSWFGYGNVHLRNGVIWDIPVFGIFSPILNAIAPGLGNSRAKKGVAHFDITNSVIVTTNLDIEATATRMHFKGTLDFEQRLNATAEAELFRDIPGIGMVLSKILWPVTKAFEYRVTGTLAKPEAEPLYIVPKILLLPFQPFKVLKDAFTRESKPSPGKNPP